MNLTYLFTALIFCSILFHSCRSSKVVDNKIRYILLLSKDKNQRYLENSYNQFKIDEIKKSSKSKNQYTVIFECKMDDCQSLEVTLKSDSEILEYERFDSHSDNIESSKGSKAHRTGPIGSHGRQ